MGKRKYTHVDEYESVILQMREEGKTRREIAEHLGLTMKQIKGWINRYNRRQRRLASGIPPKPKGRPRKRPLSGEEEYKKEIARLQMENQLLRDFLQFTERLTIKSQA